MIKGDLVFMGPPGSGKGTQAQTLVRERGMVQLSTGELFRDNIRRGTELGKKAQRFIDSGDYVPDQVTVDMVRDRLRSIPQSRVATKAGASRSASRSRSRGCFGEWGCWMWKCGRLTSRLCSAILTITGCPSSADKAQRRATPCR